MVVINTVNNFSGELPVPEEQGMCGGPRQPQQMSVLPTSEVSQAGDEPRWYVLWFITNLLFWLITNLLVFWLIVFLYSGSRH